jgi:uncharacterized membrane protein YfcA
MTATQLIILLLTGLLAGFVSGAMGVGGGIIIVPSLVFLMGLSQHEAQGTSLGVLVLPVVALGAWNYYRNGYLNVRFAIVLIIAFIIGGFIGSEVAVNLPDRLLRKIFGGVVFILSLKMIFGK